MERIIHIPDFKKSKWGSWLFYNDKGNRITQYVPFSLLDSWGLKSNKQYKVIIEEIKNE